VKRPFLIYPAIDLKDGKVVRLQQGRAEAETVYSDDPVAVALRWEEEGAQFLHVVDLDGAFTGTPRNWHRVHAIAKAVQIPIQLGGGLRSRLQVEEAMKLGVTRCIIGTKACESPAFIEKLADDFGTHVAVGIDARDGLVAVKGWTEKTKLTAVEFARQINRLDVHHIIFTDVATDGMLTGPNYFAIAAVCAAVQCQVIASGGVGSLDHVRRLQALAQEHDNLSGVIIGKALYDGRIDLQQLKA
jgi:phosphoribosylformimino-5-aminoimidazole carboxamide ribotide isomerase